MFYTKNIFLIIGAYLISVALMTNLLSGISHNNDSGVMVLFFAFIFSFFTTPLFIYMWNRLINK